MRLVLFVAMLICSSVSYSIDEVEATQTLSEKASSPGSTPSPHAPGPMAIPSLSPEQAQMILQKVQQGQKLKEDQKKALDELDKED